MKKINKEKIKNVISTIIAFGVLIGLALAIIFSITKDKIDGLQGGDIEHAMETGQLK